MLVMLRELKNLEHTSTIQSKLTLIGLKNKVMMIRYYSKNIKSKIAKKLSRLFSRTLPRFPRLKLKLMSQLLKKLRNQQKTLLLLKVLKVVKVPKVLNLLLLKEMLLKQYCQHSIHSQI
tara:strand:- start:561 stop:917 length:357 start_codon:yes stop_codon:yes gene_type:complete